MRVFKFYLLHIAHINSKYEFLRKNKFKTKCTLILESRVYDI